VADYTVTGNPAIFNNDVTIYGNLYSDVLNLGSVPVTWTSGVGDPNGSYTAPVGSLYTRTDGGSGSTLYVKESGVGNTGWVSK
jgi:hypothetical protein